jgi:hypothetical protein
MDRWQVIPEFFRQAGCARRRSVPETARNNFVHRMGMPHNIGASSLRVVLRESPLLRPVSHYKNMKGKDNRRRTKRSARLLRN